MSLTPERKRLLRIGNQNSLLASRNLGETSKAIARSLERLSTGKRVNSARDGVADYSASLRLDSQIRGISQINLGLNRALGMVQVADSAISTQLDIVQRMREIAVEGANGTLDTSTRKTLNSELQSLLEEFDRITKSTEFDAQNLLDGTLGVSSLLLDETGSSLALETPDLNLTESFKKTIGTGSFQHTTTLANGEYSYSAIFSVTIGDLNNDGALDLIQTSYDDDALFIYFGNGDGSFQALTSFGGGNGPVSVTTGDLNSDGILDLISASYDDAINVLFGNGDGSFQALTSFALGNNGTAVTTADLNNDGALDLISASSNDAINVHFGNGDGSFQALTSFGSGSGYVGTVTTGDLNGDGIPDLIWVSLGDDAINVLFGNGEGSFQALTSFAVGNGPYSVTTGDLNGDGVLDLISASEYDDSVNVLFGNGDGSFEAKVSYTGSGDMRDVTTGDLNNDGVLDLIAVSSYSFAIDVLLGNSKETAAVSDVEVLSSDSAESLINILDDTIEKLTDYRGDLGTLYTRIETAQAANLLQSESLTSAKSQIEDADFAIETAELVRNQVLQQAQVAVQSQANVQLQVVLGLLNF